MAQQTAVEWMVNGLLISNYISKDSKIMNEFIEKAKEMEKQQIMKANDAGFNEYEGIERSSEQYYNETYNNKL